MGVPVYLGFAMVGLLQSRKIKDGSCQFQPIPTLQIFHMKRALVCFNFGRLLGLVSVYARQYQPFSINNQHGEAK